MSDTNARPADARPRAVPDRDAAHADGASRVAMRGALLDASVCAFCVWMLAEMWMEPGQATIPYHLLVLSFTITYGFRVWPLGPSIGLLILITVLSGWVMYDHYLE